MEPPLTPTDFRVLVAVLGRAQQREQWARCVSEQIPRASADQLDADDLCWSEAFLEEIGNRYTHVIVGTSQVAVSQIAGQDLVESLREAGVAVALLEDEGARLDDADETGPIPGGKPSFPGPVFVPTPDGLVRRPDATWCPLVVDTARWSSTTAAVERTRPVVLHIGADGVDQGADLQPILAELHDSGFIDYQQSNRREPQDLADVLVGADIVLDQSGPTAYGLTSCEAMAAGKIVLGFVDEATRHVVWEQTGRALPIVNVTPDNAAEVVTNLVGDAEEARRIAASGRSFAEEVHDGRATAAAFQRFISPHVPEEPRRSAKRGRVVMLVDNNVVPDSRVQKQARSAAERGWDVVLIGHQRPPGTQKSWRIGKARVRLVAVGGALKKRHHVRRSARLRSPLAYDRMVMADYRRQLVRAQLAELRMDRAVFAADRSEQPTAQTTARAVHLFTRRARLAVQRRWVTVRAEKTERLASRRVEMSAPVDRLTTRFWQRIGGYRSWRWLDPSLWEWEIAYGPVIDQLKPDIIHANDFKMLGVGARAKFRARAAGRTTKLVWDAHEFLPGIKPWNDHPRWHIAQLAHEKEYAPQADAVVTVSATLADLLMVEHGLSERPTVVLNAPEVSEASTPTRSIRSECGLSAEVPLLVYSGAAAPQRGLDIMVEVLPHLLDVHVAFVVASSKSVYVKELVARAGELAVADRVHLLPYVPVNEIVTFLSTADVGVIPIHHYPNHEIALITKFLEYSHARLPIVVSDVQTMSAMVEETGQGQVFVAEDVESFAAAVQKVLADTASYRAAYNRPGLLQGWTWESAAEVLDQVYASLHPAPSATP